MRDRCGHSYFNSAWYSRSSLSFRLPPGAGRRRRASMIREVTSPNVSARGTRWRDDEWPRRYSRLQQHKELTDYLAEVRPHAQWITRGASLVARPVDRAFRAAPSRRKKYFRKWPRCAAGLRHQSPKACSCNWRSCASTAGVDMIGRRLREKVLGTSRMAPCANAARPAEVAASDRIHDFTVSCPMQRGTEVNGVSTTRATPSSRSARPGSPDRHRCRPAWRGRRRGAPSPGAERRIR